MLNVALAGNPNSGKTTLFNTLTGANQYVGNWPGVTVEKKEGFYKDDNNIQITDLPGIYSLSPYTLEEVVSREYLLNDDIDSFKKYTNQKLHYLYNDFRSRILDLYNKEN